MFRIKKAAAAAVCACVLAGVCLNASAGNQNLSPDASYETTASGSSATVSGGEVKATYVGSIVPALINVAVPTQIPFTVDTEKPLDQKTGFNQAINAEDSVLTVENDGVDLKLSVIGIKEQDTAVRGRGPDDQPGTADDKSFPFSFVPTLARLNATGEDAASALISIRAKDEAPSTQEELEEKALAEETVGNGKSVLVTVIPGGGKKVLNVFCAATGSSQIGGYSFSMTPVIKVEYDKYSAQAGK